MAGHEHSASAQPETRTGELAEERRNQILEAALTVFAREGLHEARMEDIARKAGLSKGALYLYYNSKDAVIEALLRSIFTLELRGLRSLLDDNGPVGERLLQITRVFSNEFARLLMAQPLMLEFYALAARRRSVREFMAEALDQYRRQFAALVQQGVERGEFRATINPDEAAMALIALYEGIMLMATMTSQAALWHQYAEGSMQLLLAGLRAG